MDGLEKKKMQNHQTHDNAQFQRLRRAKHIVEFAKDSGLGIDAALQRFDTPYPSPGGVVQHFHFEGNEEEGNSSPGYFKKLLGKWIPIISVIAASGLAGYGISTFKDIILKKVPEVTAPPHNPPMKDTDTRSVLNVLD